MANADTSATRIYADASHIVPFWARLPRFFLYPMHPGALALIAVAMVLAYLAQRPFFVFLLMGLVSIGVVRYGYAVLENTARGHLAPDGLFGPDADSALRPYKQWMILALAGVLTVATASWIGWGWGLFVLLLCIFALPASMMSLGVSDSLFEAISPRAIAFIIGQLGWAYALLVFLLLLLAGAAVPAFGLISHSLPPSVVLPVFFGLQIYLILVMFNLIGYALYQYHDRLGIDVAPARDAAASDDKALVARLVDENRIDEALGIAYEAQRLNPDDVDAHDRYHKLLRLAQKSERIPVHGQQLIPLLLRGQRNARALEAHAACRALQDDFRLQRAADQLALARAAATRGDGSAAMELLAEFDRCYPGSAEIPGAWLLQARILTERMRQDQAAIDLFGRLLDHYPGAAEAREARQYLTVLRNEGASGAGNRSA